MLGAWGLALGIASSVAAEPGASPSVSLDFALHGEPVTTLTLAALSGRVAPRSLKVHEPYEEKVAEFEGLPFEQVLDLVYGPAWRDEQEILFTCRDGYQPTMPVARVREHRAWLAFRRTDQADFTIEKLESGARRSIDLAPFYLVWDNLADPVVRMDGDYGWPYQLVGIDLIRVADRFPRMVPPPPVSPAVARGFTAFRMYCSRCHAINGEGGRIGQDLNAPVNPTEYRDPAWLAAWIDDPAKLVPNTRMPRISPELPDRARVIDDIIAYLGAMPATRDGAAPLEQPGDAR